MAIPERWVTYAMLLCYTVDQASRRGCVEMVLCDAVHVYRCTCVYIYIYGWSYNNIIYIWWSIFRPERTWPFVTLVSEVLIHWFQACYNISSGWRFQPLWKILVSWDDSSQYMEKCSKPPTRLYNMVTSCLSVVVFWCVIHSRKQTLNQHGWTSIRLTSDTLIVTTATNGMVPRPMDSFWSIIREGTIGNLHGRGSGIIMTKASNCRLPALIIAGNGIFHVIPKLTNIGWSWDFPIRAFMILIEASITRLWTISFASNVRISVGEHEHAICRDS